MSIFPAPMNGVRVVDLSRWIAGPHAAMMLGDMGADVIKIETPGGEASRVAGPFVNGESTYYMALNRNKRGVVLDLRSDAGKALLIELLAEADVLVENFRPGTLDEMGLDDKTLNGINSRLIKVSVSGFGQDGPYAQRGCFDSVAQAMGGLQLLTGHPDGDPVKAGYYIADYAAALHACVGTLMALVARQSTGVGQKVDIALVESLLSMTATMIPGYQSAGVVPERQGNSNPHNAPAGLFKTRDGHVQLAASSNELFRKLTRAMDRPDLATDARFMTNKLRLENSVALNAEISSWMQKLTKKEVMEKLVHEGVPAGPLSDIKEVLNDEQLRHRGFFTTIDHPVAGPMEFAGPVVRLSRFIDGPTRPAPQLGQHTVEVLNEWLGMRQEIIDANAAKGAFGAEGLKTGNPR